MFPSDQIANYAKMVHHYFRLMKVVLFGSACYCRLIDLADVHMKLAKRKKVSSNMFNHQRFWSIIGVIYGSLKSKRLRSDCGDDRLMSFHLLNILRVHWKMLSETQFCCFWSKINKISVSLAKDIAIFTQIKQNGCQYTSLLAVSDLE